MSTFTPYLALWRISSPRAATIYEPVTVTSPPRDGWVKVFWSAREHCNNVAVPVGDLVGVDFEGCDCPCIFPK